ncbi:DUF4365 domain-containing protein [Pseudomonas tolaasii]|uniref:DUF4365 domain-containing protein n=4 Tax=Pseudomonas TaxID=286 RepID=UPI00356B6CF6
MSNVTWSDDGLMPFMTNVQHFHTLCCQKIWYGGDMTEAQIKEAISKEFLRILANGHGFKVTEPPLDHGVDMVVCPVTVRRTPQGGMRYLDSPYKLDFQLKATTSAGVTDDGDQIRFDLESKTYNDLVARRPQFLPMHLILVVLDSAPPDCIAIDEFQLSVAGSAYWYLPDEGVTETENTHQIRISIPKANRLGLGFVRSCYEQLGIEV